MNYGKGISQARMQAGVSKRQLANAAGLHPSYITHIESERKQPSLGALEDISNALGISMPLLMLMSAEEHELRGIDEEEAGELASVISALVRKVEGP